MENGSPLRAQFGIIFSVAGVYLLLVSILYLYGYWNLFNLNVFEYVGISDLLSHAIFGLWPTLMGFGIGVPFLFLLTWLVPKDHKDEPRAHGDKKIRPWKGLVLLAVFAAAIAAWTFIPYPLNWLAIVIFMSLFGIPLTGTMVKRLLPNPEITEPLLGAALLVPLFAYTLGCLNATNDQHRPRPLFIDVRASGLELPTDRRDPLSYLGRLGDSYILYGVSSRRLVIVRTDKVASLVLVPKPAP